MSLQDTAFLQSQLEQLLDFHGDLESFENAPQIHLAIWSELDFIPRLEVIKNGRTIMLFTITDSNVCCDFPTLELHASTDGKWSVVSMENSRFHDQGETVNDFEYWDCMIRFDNFNDGFTEKVA